MMTFMAYCHDKLSLSFNTIKLYLSGIQHFFSLLHPDRPSFFAAHPIKAMLKGIQKTQGKPGVTCLPISGHMFCELADLLSLSPFGLGPSLVLKAASSLVTLVSSDLGRYPLLDLCTNTPQGWPYQVSGSFCTSTPQQQEPADRSGFCDQLLQNQHCLVSSGGLGSARLHVFSSPSRQPIASLPYTGSYL